MASASHWIDTGPIQPLGAVTKALEVDVLVVGGGVTGITTAFLMHEAGMRVALVERERLAMMDTGHTTAHLTFVTDARLPDLARHGEDRAEAVWDAGAAAIDQIERLVRSQELSCDFTRVPGYLHVPRGGDGSDPSLERDADLAKHLGFDATYLERVPGINVPGVRYADQARMHPLKYLAGLVAAMTAGGACVFEKSAAEEFDAEKRRARVNGHWISFERVVIATNNPLMGFAPLPDAAQLQTKLALYTSYVVGARIPRGALPDGLFWDTRDPYDYLRLARRDDHDYAIYGGEDHKTGQHDDPVQHWANLTERLRELVPDAQVDRRWSGQVIETMDGLPYIGENAPGQFIATGYCGNGLTFGTVAALLARDWAQGAANPWAELFAPDRKAKGAAWKYVRENKDFPLYYLKDRLAPAEAENVRALAPGQGMIVKSADGKVAAYRDSEGKVHKVSAVCTHMGCLVHWNTAESTWDCPCHGSRFKPTGEVLAGPAEEPLKPA